MAVFLTAFANCQSDYSERRAKMVKGQLEYRGIKDRATLEAMRKVPRHMFVPERAKGKAYVDAPPHYRKRSNHLPTVYRSVYDGET